MSGGTETKTAKWTQSPKSHASALIYQAEPMKTRESRGEVRTHFQIISKGTLTVWLSVPRRRRDSLGPLVNKIKSPYCSEGEEAPFLFSVLCHSMSCVCWTEERHDSSFSTVSLRVTAMSPHHTSPNDLSRKKKTGKKRKIQQPLLWAHEYE